MKKLFFDDFLIGGWAYARRSGVEDGRACSLAIAQLELFIMFTLTPWIVLLLKYLKFENSNVIYFVIAFIVILGIVFDVYVSKKGVFTNVDFHSEDSSRNIKKCSYYFVFLFFYLPLITYILWPVMKQF